MASTLTDGTFTDAGRWWWSPPGRVLWPCLCLGGSGGSSQARCSWSWAPEGDGGAPAAPSALRAALALLISRSAALPPPQSLPPPQQSPGGLSSMPRLGRAHVPSARAPSHPPPAQSPFAQPPFAQSPSAHAPSPQPPPFGPPQRPPTPWLRGARFTTSTLAVLTLITSPLPGTRTATRIRSSGKPTHRTCAPLSSDRLAIPLKRRIAPGRGPGGGGGSVPRSAARSVSTYSKASSWTSRKAGLDLQTTDPAPSRTMRPLQPSWPHLGMRVSSTHVFAHVLRRRVFPNSSASCGPAQETQTKRAVSP
mmetsp:Transcript_2925/g.8649  ORF Transcript_2925/g.8649 Transcript_2925/m.8649 type:complete len:307 (+) Transcript_2925:1007-1927(+)